MPSRRKSDTSNPATDLSFEEAMAGLENIVEEMEGEQLPLEELIARYENGARLLKHCETVLTGARKRVELITLADREAEKIPETETGDPDEDNDITLF
jgi:exodeoxyribonuclease VII small subunit